MKVHFNQFEWRCDVQSTIEMGGKGGGTNTNTVQSAPPADVTAAYDQTMAQAQQVAATPLTQYGGAMVAGFTPMQQQAFSNVEANQGVASPYINAAAQLTGQGAAPINVPGGYTSDQLAQLAGTGVQYGVNAAGTNIAGASQPSFSSAMNSAGTNVYGQIPQYNASTLSQYMSPYTQNVVNSTQAEFNNQNAQAQQGVIGNAISKGAWGGDRAGIAQAELANQQQLAQAPVIAGLEQSGFTNAQSQLLGQQQLAASTLGQQAQLGAQTGLGVGTAQQTAAQQQAALQQATAQQLLGLYSGQQNTGVGAQEASGWLAQNAGFGMGNLGNMAQSTTTADANQLMSAGGLQQQLQQEQLNVPYQMYTQQQAYPFQSTGWLGGIAEGLGSSAGGTTTSTSPGASSLGSLAGLGMTGLGAYALYNSANPASTGAQTTPTNNRGGRMPRGFDTGGSVPDLGGLDTNTQTSLRAHPATIGSGFIPAPPPPRTGMNPSNIQAPAVQQNNTPQELMSMGESGLGTAAMIRRDRPAPTALEPGVTHVTPRVVTNLPMEHGSMVGGGAVADSPSQTWSYDTTGHLIPAQARGGSIGFADGGAPPTPTQAWMTPAGPTTTAGGFHAPSVSMPAMPTPDTAGGSPVSGYSQIQGRPGAFIPTLGSPSLGANTSPHLAPFTGGQPMTGSVPTPLTKYYAAPNAAGVNGNPAVSPSGVGVDGINVNAQGQPVLVNAPMSASSPVAVTPPVDPSVDNGPKSIDQNAAHGGRVPHLAYGGMGAYRGSVSTSQQPKVPVGTQALNAGMTALAGRSIYNEFKPTAGTPGTPGATGTPGTPTPTPQSSLVDNSVPGVPGRDLTGMGNGPTTPQPTSGMGSGTNPITPAANAQADTSTNLNAVTTGDGVNGNPMSLVRTAGTPDNPGSIVTSGGPVTPAAGDANAAFTSLGTSAPAAAAGDTAALVDTTTTAAAVGDLAAGATAAGEGSAAADAALMILAAKRGGAVGFKAAGGPVLPENAGMGFGTGGALHRDLGGAADTVDPQAAQLTAGSNPMMGRQLSAVNAAPQQGGLTNEQTQEYAHAHGVPMMARSANMSPAAIAMANTQRMHGFTPPVATQARGGVPHGFDDGGATDNGDYDLSGRAVTPAPSIVQRMTDLNYGLVTPVSSASNSPPVLAMPRPDPNDPNISRAHADLIRAGNAGDEISRQTKQGIESAGQTAVDIGKIPVKATVNAAKNSYGYFASPQGSPASAPSTGSGSVAYDPNRDYGSDKPTMSADDIQADPFARARPNGHTPPSDTVTAHTDPAERDTRTNGFGTLPFDAPVPTNQPTANNHDYLADVKPWTPGTYSALPKRELSAIEKSPLGFALLSGGLKAMANPGLKNASPLVQLGRSIGVGGEGAVDAYGKQQAASREQQKIDQAAESQNYDKWYKGQNLSEKASSISTDLAKAQQTQQNTQNTAAETLWKDKTAAQQKQFGNNIDLFKAHIEDIKASKGKFETLVDPKTLDPKPYSIDTTNGTVYSYNEKGQKVPVQYTPDMGVPGSSTVYRSLAPSKQIMDLKFLAEKNETPSQTFARIAGLKRDPAAYAQKIDTDALKLMGTPQGSAMSLDQARQAIRTHYDSLTTAPSSAGAPPAPGTAAGSKVSIVLPENLRGHPGISANQDGTKFQDSLGNIYDATGKKISGP